jgi:type II secretion system protein G
MNKKQKGFTLIELLVVIAIIGLLSTLAVVALNNARQKSRDAKRVADVKQIQTALELYYNDNSDYPNAVSAGGAIGATTTYMAVVPTAPTPPAGNAYTYTRTGAGTYTIVYSLEGSVQGITCTSSPCTHTASPAGLTNP